MEGQRRALGDQVPHRGEGNQPGQAEQHPEAPASPQHPGEGGERDRQGRPHQHGLGPGVGPVVGPVGVRTDGGQVPHEGRRRRRPDHAEPTEEEQSAAAAGPLAPAATGPGPAPQHRQHHQRPNQVELLLDRQGPRVQERRGWAAGGEVPGVASDEVPVGHVEQGGGAVGGGVGPHQGAVPQEGHHAQRCDQDEQCRQQTPGPAGPEPPEGDRPPVVPLEHQQGRDQVARQHEERVDPVEAPRDPREPVVVRHDRQHREGPEAVEPGGLGKPGTTIASGRRRPRLGRDRRGVPGPGEGPTRRLVGDSGRRSRQGCGGHDRRRSRPAGTRRGRRTPSGPNMMGVDVRAHHRRRRPARAATA